MHTIVYISGKIGSGKTKLADILVDILTQRKIETQRVSYASELKKQMYETFSINKEGDVGNCTYTDFNRLYYFANNKAAILLDNYVDKYSKTSVDYNISLNISKVLSYVCMYHVLDDIELRKLYARFILQTWGTEVGRAISDGTIWADYLIEHIKSVKKDTVFIVDDLRFLSEYIHVTDCGYKQKLIYIKGIKSPEINHTSETELLFLREKCDTYILNTYDLEDLTRKAYTFIDTELGIKNEK